MLGFLSMLIALVAFRHARGRLDSDKLGLTQIKVFSRVTGVVIDDSIGEQVCLLSASNDESFLGHRPRLPHSERVALSRPR